VEGPFKAFQSKGSFLALLGERGWLRRASFRVVGHDVGPLACLSLVVALSLFVFLALGDDDGAGISPDVDDIAEIIVGVVMRFSNIFL